MRDQTIIQAFQQHDNQIAMLEHQLRSMTHVLKEIVGKELMRNQALHKVLMDKGLFTDEELKTGLETLMTEAKAELEAQAKKVEEEKTKAVEILIPADAKTDGSVPEIITPTNPA